MYQRTSCIGLTLVLTAMLAGQASAATPALHRPREAARAAPTARIAASAAAAAATAAATVIENGRQCSVIGFEGVGDLAAIPEFDGIASPGWLGIIDADAGGTGNFAQEPSPQTIAFWLGGDPGSRDIVMTNVASKVEFYYASAVGMTLQALDETGNEVARASGGANYNLGVGDPNGQFNRWDRISVETPGNLIKTVRVTGNTNQTGIDNLKVCSTVGVASVEVTQAIQQVRPIADLKTQLAAGREAAVPLVARKPAVARFYMDKVNAVTDVTLRLSGVVSQTRKATLQPHCTPAQQRAHQAGCRSIDFYFTPPAGNWDLTAEVVDSAGAVLATHALPFSSRTTRALALKAVSVCDARSASGAWLCAPASALASKVGFLRSIMPTAGVTVATTANAVRRRASDYADTTDWWVAAASDANAMHAAGGGGNVIYYGMVRPELAGGIGGIAHGIPSHAALGHASAIRLGTETVTGLVSHEVGHTLGLRHTNTSAPAAAGAPPGCYSLASDSATDWPFGDNTIQSTDGPEVGFDVAAGKPLRPDANFEFMAYCVPRWISPQRYRSALTALGGGAAARTTATATATAEEMVAGQFWTVAGVIDNAAVRFAPVFDDASLGYAGSGSGEYRIEVRAADGGVLFVRYFDPSQAHTESEDDDVSGPPSFLELIPVTPNAAALLVFDGGGRVLGTLAMGGAAPQLAIVQPMAGLLGGEQVIRWTVTDPDSTRHAAKVLYSNDNGATWSELGRVDHPAGAGELQADMASLPGGAGSVRIKVVVSDGANTASALAGPFSVAKKALSDVSIVAPAPGAAYAQQAMVQLEGVAYDIDDGILDGKSVTWRSSLDGVLGSGALFQTTALSAGVHQVTMQATDGDGNSASAQTSISIAGAAPTVNLAVRPLDTLPTRCVEATIGASPGVNGLALDMAEYSLNGGADWTTIPLARLPLKFIVPGSGFIHLVARAFDRAGQVSARDAKLFVDAACVGGGAPRIAASIAARGMREPGVMFVDLVVRNDGTGAATGIAINKVDLRVLAGSGSVVLRDTPLPLPLPDLAAGQSGTVRLHLAVPASVTRLSLTESGTLKDRFGRALAFSINQSLIP